MKYLACIFIVFVFISCNKAEIENKPNIILIMADDMGYECLGCNGNTEYQTPVLDKLAAEAIRFDNCFSQPLCTPSRVKIMTGKFNYRNYEDFGYLNPNQQTFANLLKEAGYKTCIAGKWQLNGLNRNNPNNQDVNRPYHFGFDEYCLWQLHHDRKDGERFANALITQNGHDLPRDPDSYGPQIFADYICDFIERKKDSSFFVYYPMVLVHEPFVPTPGSPDWNIPENRYKKDTAYFAHMMAFTDKIVGQIIAKLKETNTFENTLFVFTADNGTHHTIYSSTQNGIIQGAKGENINYGNHVPLIVSWPKKMQAKKITDALVSFADFLPTFCEVAGIDSTTFKSDGKSLVSLITGENQSVQDEIFIHYSPRWGNWSEFHKRWVLNGNYKLYNNGKFFNTKNDPLEKNELTDLNETEQNLKNRFQIILDANEKEIPFALNDSIFKVQY